MAQSLYFRFARDLPIIDFHSHLPPGQIAGDIRFDGITKLWLGGDHYKWRLMRLRGIGEERITGSADDYDKFLAWAQTVPYAVGHPVFHWSHLELKKFFHLPDRILQPENAREIYEHCNALLRTELGLSARGLLLQNKVEVLYTTDDPLDGLTEHRALRDESFPVAVRPTFRPDRFFRFDSVAWLSLVEELGAITRGRIDGYDRLVVALEERIKVFHENGCRIADHAFAEMPTRGRDAGTDAIFHRLLQNGTISTAEYSAMQWRLLKDLAGLYRRQGWTMQLHLGARRNTNQRMFARLGADSGYDSIGASGAIDSMIQFIDSLNQENQLPRLILYPMSVAEYEAFVTLAGSFGEANEPGKIQLGAAWWFQDYPEGILQQLRTSARMGMLRVFVGMVTDSRSFLSFVRHDYFRRVLCNFLADEVKQGLLPADENFLGKLITEISYENAKQIV